MILVDVILADVILANVILANVILADVTLAPKLSSHEPKARKNAAFPLRTNIDRITNYHANDYVFR